jgi:uncharacterized protein (TIGR02466 family)
MNSACHLQNVSIEVRKEGNSEVLFTHLEESAAMSNISLREEYILSAGRISKLNDGAPVALLIENNYESAVAYLSFKNADVPFTLFEICFKDKNRRESRESEIATWISLDSGLITQKIVFDYENPEHLEGLEKLREANSASSMGILFQTWASCNIDELVVIPGKFIVPVYNLRGDLYTWTLPSSESLSISEFFKKFGGIHSFICSTTAGIHKQANADTNRMVRHLRDVHRRYVERDHPTYRRCLALDFGFPEIDTFTEPVHLLPEYKLALRSFDRKTKEDITSFEQRVRQNEHLGKSQNNLKTLPMIADETLFALPAFAKLKNVSRKTDYTGSVIETAPESGGHCLAFFPSLCTVHEYSEDLQPLRDFLKSREYFSNSSNNYSRTDLHFHPEMEQLVKFFRTSVKFYFEKVDYLYEDFEILQCWANKTRFKQLHHQHRHPNSMISGVFYLDHGGGDTVFTMHDTRELSVATTRPTPWNRRPVHVKPSPGRLILFPSTMEHHTLTHNDSEKDRYTLSFNVIIRGEIGELSSGTWLNL